VDAVLVAGTRAALSTPFVAYGFPDKTSATIRMTRGDGTTGHILSFAGFISVAVEDQYCNLISNQEVTFTVQPASEREPHCSNPSTDTTPAVLVKTNDPCLQSSPTHGQCGTQSNSLDEITSSGGAAVEVILGGIPHGDYPIVAASVGLSSTTFHLFTYPRGNCDGDTAPQHSLLLEYVYPTDLYGHNINAVQYDPDPEKQTSIPLMGRMYFLREGETTKKDCGEACDKIVGTHTYTVDNKFRSSSMTFGGKAGTEIEPKGRGFFTYDYKPEKIGLNDVEIHGSATATNNIQMTTVDCSRTPPLCETDSIPLTASGTIKMQVYGVNIQVPEKLLILVDESGFAVGDTPIQYTIEPSEYTAATAYVAIIRDGSPMWYIPGKTKGTDTVTLAKGYWFDINGTYKAQVVLNYGTGVEIKSAEIPLKVACFKIVKPEKGQEILIKNNESGEPQMPSLTAEVTLQGKDITPANLEVYWKVKVEYIVNLPQKYASRSRKGLDCDAQGVCKGTDGFPIPSKDWTKGTGLTYTIDWGDNFGGGILEITAKTTIDGVEVSDTYVGKIEGQEFKDDNKFKEKICKYLENPTGVPDYQTILYVLGHSEVFRIIAYQESKYKHFYPSKYGVPKDAIYPLENDPPGDGGFGLMQLTNPAPQYKEIWNWQENIHAGIRLIKEKIVIAKSLLKEISGGQPLSTDDIGKSILRMETYYQYGPKVKGVKRYWIWDKKTGWVESTDVWLYADTLRAIELNVNLEDFTSSTMREWKYDSEQ